MRPSLVEEVLNSLVKSKNVLLYGPPGTGKTWLLSQLIERLKSESLSSNGGADKGRPALILGEDSPFGSVVDKNGSVSESKSSNGISNETLPRDLTIEWLTFHQSYSYEDFIIGKKPKPADGGMILEPHFGTLMSLAVSLDTHDKEKGCLIIIDEINRANASQVFGEFITLLDPSYRRTIKDSKNDRALPVKFPGIEYDFEGISEGIKMLRGGSLFQLPENWTFPEHVYILATMNSVDKAALPLDSALTRRFHRVEMRPNIDLLAEALSVNMSDLTDKVKRIRSKVLSWKDLTSEETATLLLDRLNVFIASDIGSDFELGHALVWNVVEAEKELRWSALISAWDNMLYPQLIDKFSGRNDALKTILKIHPNSVTMHAFTERSQIGNSEDDIEIETTSICFKLLKNIDEQQAIRVLKNLAI